VAITAEGEDGRIYLTPDTFGLGKAELPENEDFPKGRVVVPVEVIATTDLGRFVEVRDLSQKEISQLVKLGLI